MSNRLDAELLITAGVEGLPHLDRLIDRIEAAGGDTDQLREAAARLRDEWDNLSTEEQANQLRNLSNAANRSADDVGLLGRNAEDAGDASDSLGKKVGGLKNALSGLQGLLATLGVTMGASELLEAADAYKTLEARVKLATGEGVNFITAFNGVKSIADETFTSIEDTGELFSRIARAGEDMQLAQSDVLQVTKTINEAIKLSGGTAESNQAAITQLIQGLQSGVLRGEEFNSIMEQAPRLARAMADGLGITVGQLREMANQGQLTSEVVINAVRSQGEAIQGEFEKLPDTVGNSLIQLKNNFLSFVGDIDKQVNSSSGVSSIIQKLATSLDEIDPATLDAVREAFSQLGEIAKTLTDTTGSLADGIAGVWNAFDGTTEAGEKVGLLTKSLQELSIFIGHIADGVKGIQIVADTVFGGWIMSIGLISQAYAKLTGSSTAAGDAMMAKGNEMVERAKKNALEFESSAIKAADNAAKTHQQRLDETAEKSRQAYEEMAVDGQTSAGKIQEAYIKAATDTIKANNNVIDARLEAELAEKGLQAQVNETGKIAITALQNTQAAVEQIEIGGILQADLESAGESFKTLGLDAQEFATGINSELTQTLSAFSTVANIAEGDTVKLALAYNAASEQIGTNAQAQALLQQQLLASTNGNQQLAAQVTQTAAAQRAAKEATDAQAQALSALGVSMAAVNQGMSASGLEMVTNLRTGIAVIKEQATSADALKTALTQALDTSIAAAKTKEDFAAIGQALKEAGVASSVTSEQMQLIKAGMQGGADAASAAAQSIDAQTQSLLDNADAAGKNTNASQTNASSKVDQAEAADKATESETKLADQQSHSLAIMQQAVAGIKEKIAAMQGEGSTVASVDAHYQQLLQSIGAVNKRYLDMAAFGRDMERLNTIVEQQAQHFDNVRQSVISHTQALSGAEISSNDLASAQTALRKATSDSAYATSELGRQTLDSLRSAIDSARNKMQGLANDAKNTADNLAATLAKMQGNDDKAREIEQSKKLADIETKLNEAKARGNSEEIKQLERALDLQRKINTEEERQARAQAQQARQREQAVRPAPTPAPEPIVNTPVTPNVPANAPSRPSPTIAIPSGSNLSPSDIINSLDIRVVELIKTVGVEEFAKRLQDEAKRRPI